MTAPIDGAASAGPATGLCAMGLAEAARRLSAGEVSSIELTEAALARIAATRHLGAWLHVGAEEALAQAAASDRRRRADGPRSPLEGVPLGLKDNLATRDAPTTCASRMLAGYRSPFDAHVVERLAAAGAVLVGKTNMDEFGMGSTSEHSAFGPVLNPFDRARVAGGSSGGSAAAVAAGDVFASLGTDTGGSIRQPASFCGLVGLKPTYGRVSRHGLIAYGSSLDQVGPLARSTLDAALVLAAIAGPDARDATVSAAAVDDSAAAARAGAREGALAGVTIGVLGEGLGDGVDPEVARAMEAARAALVARGARLREISLPSTAYGIATYYVLAPAEAASNLARFDAVRYGRRAAGAATLHDAFCRSRQEGLGPEVRRRILLGTFVLSARQQEAYFGRAQAARRLVVEDFARAFGEVDLLACPTSPTVATPLGAHKEPLAMYLADVFTVGANLAGLPAISVPAGHDATGMPIGMQLIGPALAEARLIEVAAALEAAALAPARRPPC